MLPASWRMEMEALLCSHTCKPPARRRLRPEAVVATFGLVPAETIDLGETEITQAELHAFLDTVSHKYTPQSYNLLRHNCNNFSDEVSKFLLGGRGIPRHIIDLPNEVMQSPIGAMLQVMP